MTELRTNGSVVNGLGQQHIDNISGFVTDAPDLSGLLNSHGVIGNPTDFGGAYEARANAMKATKAASEKMSDLLSQAAAAYDRGDVEAARKLKAQADQIEGKGGPGSPSAGGPGGQDGGSQAAGQIMGQFSQLAGQVVQGVTQPVQGIMQGVSQMPQQVFQGVRASSRRPRKLVPAQRMPRPRPRQRVRAPLPAQELRQARVPRRGRVPSPAQAHRAAVRRHPQAS